MEILIPALIIGLLPALLAHRKGRSFIAWWIFGAALFIIALPMSLLMKADQKTLDNRAVSGGDMRKCPNCAEVIRAEARVCKHCGRDVVGDAVVHA